jgi:hypothetical protein
MARAQFNALSGAGHHLLTSGRANIANYSQLDALMNRRTSATTATAKTFAISVTSFLIK